MIYNGQELIEMKLENWDGRSREMLVWSDCDTEPILALVCGFTLKGHPIADTGNYKKENGFKRFNIFQYCSEIPNKEKEDVKKLMKMADSVSSAVWKELMNRAENIDGPVNTMMPGFGFNDISDIVLNKILQYIEPIEGISDDSKQEVKMRRMTYRELAEWLVKGNGQYKEGLFGDIRTEFVYRSFDDDKTLNDDYLIRKWNEKEWHEPLIKE